MRKLPFCLHKAVALALPFAFCASIASAAPILSERSHGHDVLKLQQSLRRAGYSVDVDGVFGASTKSAVLRFQSAQGIRETGVVDRETWDLLQGLPLTSTQVQKKTTTDKTDASFATDKVTAHTYVPDSSPFLTHDEAMNLIADAKKYIGTPYLFGGSTPKAFDCSGYLQYVFRENGVRIPRTADEQYYKLGKSTKSKSELVPGDLVFFQTYEKGPSHNGIYLGDGKFIHASSSRGVRIDELGSDYWQARYYGGKHIVKQ